MTPAMQTYVDQFKQSQAAQQQALNANLIQALGGLGERRSAAAKVAATLPGQFNQAYEQAAQSQAQAAQQAGFGHPVIGAGRDQALITAANTQQRAAGLANQPLLQAGITADYSKGQTALQNTNMQNQSAIAQAQQDFARQLFMAQQAQQSTEKGYAHDVSMAKLESDLALRNATATSKTDNALTNAQNAQALQQGFTSFAEKQAALQSGDYRGLQQAQQAATAKGANSEEAKYYVRYLHAVSQSNPSILKALRANGIISDNDLAALYGQAPKA
jgi:hypothetical protein